jgi:putative glutamine amidotransferase
MENIKEINMERPIIGVSPLWDEKKGSIWMAPEYMRGLEEAGAVPVLLPLTATEAVLKQAARLFDGFLFTGGPDMHPRYFGQEVSPHCGEICDMRDQLEAYIFNEAVINQNKPALGICRGIQVINIMLGGNLYQDIPAELPSTINHRQEPPYDVPVHNVRLLPGSPLCKLAGKESLEVNSCHHQGIDRIAERLEVMALSDDGLIEAVHMPDHPFVWAVQWHPECSLKFEISKKIFSAFVKAVEKSARHCQE